MTKKTRVIDKDHGWREMMRRAEQIKHARVKVGVLSDEGQGGLHVPGSDLTVAEIAVVNEYGTQDKVVPARPFLRPTFDEQVEGLASMGKKLIRAVLDGKMDVEQALGIMGSKLATEVKRKITSGPGIPPPNRPAVAARKQAKGAGAIRTLVDTGRMVGAITWAVVMGDKNE
jgi:hypothetical protein